MKVSVTSTGNEVSEVRASVRHEVQTEVGVSPFGMASACASTAAGVLEAVASCEASWAAAVVGSAAGSLEVAGEEAGVEEVAGEDELGTADAPSSTATVQATAVADGAVAVQLADLASTPRAPVRKVNETCPSFATGEVLDTTRLGPTVATPAEASWIVDDQGIVTSKPSSELSPVFVTDPVTLRSLPSNFALNVTCREPAAEAVVVDVTLLAATGSLAVAEPAGLAPAQAAAETVTKPATPRVVSVAVARRLRNVLLAPPRPSYRPLH